MQTESVRFKNRTWDVAADLRVPDGFDPAEKHPAIVCAHPISSCKEQTSGNVYAERLTELGQVTLAFDASHQGQSGGEPRYLEDPATRGRLPLCGGPPGHARLRRRGPHRRRGRLRWWRLCRDGGEDGPPYQGAGHRGSRELRTDCGRSRNSPARSSRSSPGGSRSPHRGRCPLEVEHRRSLSPSASAERADRTPSSCIAGRPGPSEPPQQSTTPVDHRFLPLSYMASSSGVPLNAGPQLDGSRSTTIVIASCAVSALPIF